MPREEAEGPLTLQPGDWLVIESAEPFQIVLSPAGLGTVKDERAVFKTGPINFGGVFADAKVPNRGAERRTYEKEFVQSISGAAVGTGELIVVRKGGAIERAVLAVVKPGTQPGPAPATDFAAAVKGAITPAEAADARGYAAAYQKGLDVADTADTWGTLFLVVKAEADSRQLRGKLAALNAVVQAELKSKLPNGIPAGTTPLTASDRQAAKLQFGRVITAITEATK